jgi:hypothetical protein
MGVSQGLFDQVESILECPGHQEGCVLLFITISAYESCRSGPAKDIRDVYKARIRRQDWIASSMQRTEGFIIIIIIKSKEYKYKGTKQHRVTIKYTVHPVVY